MQLLVKIGDSENPLGYKDGDVVDTFSELRIGYTHAEMVCKAYDLEEYFLSKTSRYKFRKDGSGVIRTDLLTQESDIITAEPNDRGEYIDVDLYIERHPEKIYENNVWYGGSVQPTENSLEAIWNFILATRGIRREQYEDWPVTDLEKRHFLPLSCCGTGHLSNGTVCERKQSIYDTTGDEPVLVARRKWFVPYWDLGYDVDRVRNTEIPYDCRLSHDDSPLLDDTVLEKQL